MNLTLNLFEVEFYFRKRWLSSGGVNADMADIPLYKTIFNCYEVERGDNLKPGKSCEKTIDGTNEIRTY